MESTSLDPMLRRHCNVACAPHPWAVGCPVPPRSGHLSPPVAPSPPHRRRSRRALPSPAIAVASPARTYALVVGIAEYDAGAGWELYAPVADAARAVLWLLRRGVPPEQILLFLSP